MPDDRWFRHPDEPPWVRQLEYRLKRFIYEQLKTEETELMADITQAEQDLADAVSATATRVQDDIAALKQAIADGNTAATQQAADAIEAQVANLANIDPASPPTPAPAPPA